jgi:hypothetical protein
MKAFTAALESMGKPRFMIGRIPPTPGLVDPTSTTVYWRCQRCGEISATNKDLL